MALIDIENCAWRFIFPASCVTICLGTMGVPFGGAILLSYASCLSASFWTVYLLFGGKVVGRFVRADGSRIKSHIASSRLLICAALMGVLAVCACRHVHLPWPLALQQSEVDYVAFDAASLLVLGHVLLGYSVFRERRQDSST